MNLRKSNFCHYIPRKKLYRNLSGISKKIKEIVEIFDFIWYT